MSNPQIGAFVIGILASLLSRQLVPVGMVLGALAGMFLTPGERKP